MGVPGEKAVAIKAVPAVACDEVAPPLDPLGKAHPGPPRALLWAQRDVLSSGAVTSADGLDQNAAGGNRDVLDCMLWAGHDFPWDHELFQSRPSGGACREDAQTTLPVPPSAQQRLDCDDRPTTVATYEPVATDLVDCFLAATLKRVGQSLPSSMSIERLAAGLYRVHPSGLHLKLSLKGGRLFVHPASEPPGEERAVPLTELLHHHALPW